VAATVTIYPAYQDSARFVGTSPYKVALLTATYSYNAAHTVYANLTNELTTALGYTSGGQSLASVTYTRSGAVLPLDAADLVWTAAGGSLVASTAVIYVDATINAIVKPLVAFIALDGSPVTVTDGNTLTLTWNAAGILTSTIA
jgi:hypothetical protein